VIVSWASTHVGLNTRAGADDSSQLRVETRDSRSPIAWEESWPAGCSLGARHVGSKRAGATHHLFGLRLSVSSESESSPSTCAEPRISRHAAVNKSKMTILYGRSSSCSVFYCWLPPKSSTPIEPGARDRVIYTSATW